MSTATIPVLDASLKVLARCKQTPVSVKQLVELGERTSVDNLLSNARFLHRELPLRLARRSMELRSLPYGLSEMPSVIRVINTYERSFDILRLSIRPSTLDENKVFCEKLETLYNYHNNVLPLMAKGLSEMKAHLPSVSETECPFLNDFLNRFFLARIGIRVLASHHLALSNPRPGYNGVFKRHTQVRSVVEGAVEATSSVCNRHYGICPKVKIIGEQELSFPYIPSHFHYCIFELLKNSMRAIVENKRNGAEDSLPPIEIIFAKGSHDLSVKVSDMGGGISRANIAKAFQYGYTTAAFPHLASDLNLTSPSSVEAPMAGLGYGLPLCRLYARAFGGDLSLLSMDGYGTDAYLNLRSVDGVEFVPE